MSPAREHKSKSCKDWHAAADLTLVMLRVITPSLVSESAWKIPISECISQSAKCQKSQDACFKSSETKGGMGTMKG